MEGSRFKLGNKGAISERVLAKPKKAAAPNAFHGFTCQRLKQPRLKPRPVYIKVENSLPGVNQ